MPSFILKPLYLKGLLFRLSCSKSSVYISRKSGTALLFSKNMCLIRKQVLAVLNPRCFPVCTFVSVHLYHDSKMQFQGQMLIQFKINIYSAFIRLQDISFLIFYLFLRQVLR